jgi:hypothetical protein
MVSQKQVLSYGIMLIHDSREEPPKLPDEPESIDYHYMKCQLQSETRLENGTAGKTESSVRKRKMDEEGCPDSKRQRKSASYSE